MAGRFGTGSFGDGAVGFPKPGAVFSWMAQQCDARADASRGAASRLIRRVDAGSVSGGKLAKKGQPNACDKAAWRDDLRSDGGLRTSGATVAASSVVGLERGLAMDVRPHEAHG